MGIYGGWSIAEEVTTDDRWSVEGLVQAMDKLPHRVEVNTQMARLAEAAR